MQDWQVQRMLEAQAITVRVEGMKVENAIRAMQGKQWAYGENDFIDQADEIDRLAREIGMH